MQKIVEKLMMNMGEKSEGLVITRIVDKELNKEYDVYLITGGSKEYVVKKDSSGDEVRIYKMLAEKAGLAVPRYLTHEKDQEDNVWMLMERIQGATMVGGAYEEYISLAKNLAKIHRSFLHLDKTDGDIEFLKGGYDRLSRRILKVEEMDDIEEYEITKAVTNGLLESLKSMKNGPQTLIHDDLLPINVMKENGDIKVIDWEYGSLGFYTSDIGRLLGDLKSDKCEYWVSREWEEGILKAYYCEISNNQEFGLSYDQFLYDYRCSRMFNYAGIVLSFAANRWEITDWYRVNLKEMKKYLNM